MRLMPNKRGAGKGGFAVLWHAQRAWPALPDRERSASDQNSKMREHEIIDTNAENIDGCSFCGYKDANNLGHRRKTDWLKERYAEGLRFKVLRSRRFGDIGMIEYAPGNHAWRPVEAEGYLVIHCLMVNGKHKGKGLGTLLLDSCLRDARKSKCRGVAVVTSSDSFMARSDFFIKAGFVSVESSPPYELLVKKLKKSAPDPRFIVQTGATIEEAQEGPYDPGCGSVPDGSKVREGHYGDVENLGTGAKSGSSQ